MLLAKCDRVSKKGRKYYYICSISSCSLICYKYEKYGTLSICVARILGEKCLKELNKIIFKIQGLSKKETCLRGRGRGRGRLAEIKPFLNLFISIIKILKHYNINNITNSSQFARKYCGISQKN